MRLVLKEDKQKELIKKEKENLSLSFPKLAKKLGIKTGRLYAYYYNKILLPKKLFEKFSLKEKYRKYIIDKKEDNWGQSKGGNKSKGKTKEIKVPKECRELAEFYGIMLGDGNLTVKKSYKIGTYQIRIVGDSRFDKEYLINYVKPLIERLFDIKVKANKIKNENAIKIVATGKKLAEFLQIKGFKPGDKIINQLEIPSWIKENPEFLKVCLRGLYDTDGCVYKLTNQNSYQIMFKNYNMKLLEDTRNGLISLGIKPSKITIGKSIMVTKKSELRRFLNEIGFSNSKHVDKVKTWDI